MKLPEHKDSVARDTYSFRYVSICRIIVVQRDIFQVITIKKSVMIFMLAGVNW